MNQDTLIIRADADERMGTGHIMRCIALAQEWRQQKGPVLFVSCLSNRAVLKRLTSMGFEVCLIKKSFPDPMDIHTTLQKAKEKNAKILVTDGYHFLPEYHEKIRSKGIKLMVIDDYNHLPFYHGDILLNQNLGAEKIQYNTLPGAVKLLGPEFIMLRNEFLTVKRADQPQTGNIENILITMGGTDPDNTTLKIIRALNLLTFQTFNLKIVLGPGNRNAESIHHESVVSRHQCKIVTNAANMPELILWADVAISAGGSTAWELLYLRTPVLFLINADNQMRLVEEIASANAGINAGRHDRIRIKDIAQKIGALINDPSLRDQIVYNTNKLVDGNGRGRIVQSLLYGLA
nr:UDP-2,4-diacetamido-2,4,6-trideoxy-beta-L-altropyranose hydrolase [uncultured Desulfobacter sp.]